MAADEIVEYQVICHGCGYNLRGLCQHTTCPQCGAVVFLALCDAAVRTQTPAQLNAFRAISDRIRSIAANSALTLDALTFLWYAINYLNEARRHRTDPPARNAPPLAAPDLCLAMRDLAAIAFGAAAGDTLRSFNLATAADAGKAMEALLQGGLLNAEDGQSNAGFFDADCPDPSDPPQHNVSHQGRS